MHAEFWTVLGNVPWLVTVVTGPRGVLGFVQSRSMGCGSTADLLLGVAWVMSGQRMEQRGVE